MDNILEIAILEMIRQRGKKPFELYEVIKWIFPEDWQHFTSEIETAAHHLEEMGKINLTASQVGESTKLTVMKVSKKSKV
ncbi:hypothetical protein KZP23_17805 [Echinicola marina]|uniref:hypothetical protein n=1 Tax=Echinicola marina TaxID=2859768 RepID=UPI001CF6946A|nr:hypothetical protein [Echinicola marina]UCS92528.1 hypothetical protein KZP23_17805 [Echinicola marina]